MRGTTDTVRSAIISLSVEGWHHYIEGRHVSSDVGQNDNEERLREERDANITRGGGQHHFYFEDATHIVRGGTVTLRTAADTLRGGSIIWRGATDR